MYFVIGDKWRVVLKKESQDYIHAVFVNVSSNYLGMFMCLIGALLYIGI